MKRKYAPIGDTLKVVLQKNNLDNIVQSKAFEKKWSAWDPTIIRYAKIKKYDSLRGLVLIEVNDPLWKKEFITNKEILLTRMKNDFRNFNISDIEIV